MSVVFIATLLENPGFGWEFILGGCASVALVDAAIALTFKAISIRRQVPQTVAIFKPARVELSLTSDIPWRVRIDVADNCPPDLKPSEERQSFWIRKTQRINFDYGIKPIQRGIHTLDSVGLLIRSPLGFWWTRRQVPVNSVVRVYPDFASISHYLELLIERRTTAIGLKKVQRRGAGLEFQQLRDYRQGDAMNRIDWNATSKRRQLISREYDDEQNQTLIFVLDTSRRLRSKDNELSHFDHVLNAMVLMSYIALRQGDSVGILTFGFLNRWIPPIAGVPNIKKLLNSVFDLDAGLVSSDFVTMAEELEKRHRKRAMIVLLTNLRDEDYELVTALKMLRKRHLVILANLREELLDRLQEQPIASFADALAAAGAAKYERDRLNLQLQFTNYCNLLIDSLPSEIHVHLANAYWAIKRGGKL